MELLAQTLAAIDPWIALGVVAATALTDGVCVLYTASVAHRRDVAAANWGAMTYMLSAFAVISFTSNPAYVVFAAFGAWLGTYATMKYLRWRSARDQASAADAAPASAAAPAGAAAPPSRQALPSAPLPPFDEHRAAA
jgi:hypothetical protein